LFFPLIFGHDLGPMKVPIAGLYWEISTPIVGDASYMASSYLVWWIGVVCGRVL
jgi:hypothetical protein